MAREQSRLLGELLIKSGKLTQEQFKDALDKQQLSGKLLGELLVELNYATEQDITMALSQQYGIPFIDLDKYSVDKDVLKIFPERVLREMRVVPLFKIEKSMTVAMNDPLDIRAIDRLSHMSKCDIDPMIATKSSVQRALDKIYGSVGSMESVIEGIKIQGAAMRDPSAHEDFKAARGSQAKGGRSDEKLDALLAATEKAPVVRLVNSILKQAVDNKASDIHIEPEAGKTYIRYRIDGILYDVPPPPKDIEAAVISRIKIMSNMDIAEKRLPQDGRIETAVEGREIDYRVSTFPTIYGENVSIRVLDKGAVMTKLEELGFEKDTLDSFKTMLLRPYGIILVTGPTGSGKTTTLYGALRVINSTEKNVITLEDPVEYRITRVRQSQIDVKSGLTFASGLRSIVRQDPDIILIGEIRDVETAEISIRSALTGHLVLSTLHTNDAPSALTRLTDMGIEPFLVSSSIVGILAQRLMRTLCKKCKKPYKPPKEVLEALDIPKGEYNFYKLAGCSECKNTGYRGRSGIFELMEVNDDIKALAMRKASAAMIKSQAIKDGMITLRRDAVRKFMSGSTSVEEVYRVTEKDVVE